MELNEFSNLIQTDLTSSNIVFVLKQYHHGIEQLKYKEQISDEKIRILEEELGKIKAQRLKCISLTKQMNTK